MAHPSCTMLLEVREGLELALVGVGVGVGVRAGVRVGVRVGVGVGVGVRVRRA